MWNGATRTDIIRGLCSAQGPASRDVLASKPRVTETCHPHTNPADPGNCTRPSCHPHGRREMDLRGEALRGQPRHMTNGRSNNADPGHISLSDRIQGWEIGLTTSGMDRATAVTGQYRFLRRDSLKSSTHIGMCSGKRSVGHKEHPRRCRAGGEGPVLADGACLDESAARSGYLAGI